MWKGCGAWLCCFPASLRPCSLLQGLACQVSRHHELDWVGGAPLKGLPKSFLAAQPAFSLCTLIICHQQYGDNMLLRSGTCPVCREMLADDDDEEEVGGGGGEVEVGEEEVVGGAAEGEEGDEEGESV